MELITERLILREFVESDWEAMLAYENKPLYLRYYEWTTRTKEGVQEFIGWFTAQQQDNPRYKYHLVVTLKDTGRMIGMCGVRKDTFESHKADIGYELDPDYWNKGYATEAARTMLNYGFTHLNAERIWAHCVADNTGSIHVLEKSTTAIRK